MSAVVDRGMVTPTSAAVLRGASAVNEVRDLLDQLSKVDADLESFGTLTESNTYGPFCVTTDELQSVIQRRRDVILNKLQNKGIRIAPDPELTTHAPPLERALADTGTLPPVEV